MPPPSHSPQQLLEAGLAQLNAGRLPEAEAAFRAVLARDKGVADAHHLLGLVALRAGRPAEAIAAIERAVKLRPAEPSFRSNLGVALKAAGRRREAIAALREAVRRSPGYVQAHVNLGNTFREEGQLEAAADAYRAALKHAPEQPAILNNLGNVCRELGDLEAASAQYRRAIEIAPTYLEAMANLASAELARGEAEASAGLLERVLEADANNAMARLTLGRALLHLERYAEAEAAFRRAVALLPGLAEAHAGLADVLVRRGDVAGAIGAYQAAVAIRPDFAAARSGLVFMRNYEDGDDPLAVTREARAFGEALPRRTRRVASGRNPDPHRPLTVGLVSGDFRSHAVATFLAGVLPEIDQSHFRLIGYATSAHRDRVTERIEGWLGGWRNATAMGDAALAEQIAADGVDILVDLSGHTMFNRLPVFALRPAPVQMSWLGYSGTTGVAEIDYVLGDRFVTPPGEELQFVEAPWRMPDSYLCWSPPQLDVAVGSLPAQRNGHVTFGSFNNISKLSGATVALWSRVLDAVPGSRLLLKAGPLGEPAVAAATRQRFAGHGISEERLTLIGRVAEAAGHLSSYGEVDIGLDPIPYNGTTTTAEALWMGVPVLALRGDRFIAHVGESMLTSAGLPEWVAANEDDYVRRAKSFAADPAGLSLLRAQLRAQLVASPLCNGKRFARNLEAAWRGMWQRWCAER